MTFYTAHDAERSPNGMSVVEVTIHRCREAVALAPGLATVWSELGTALVAACEQALKLSVPVSGVWTNEIQRLDEAVACHRRSLAISPDALIWRTKLADALCLLGIACRRQGLIHKAIACHGESVRLEPGRAWGWSNLGNCLKDLKYLERAAECHRRAIDLDSAQPAFLCNLGIALATANRSKEALACFDAVLRQEPDDANTRWDRALTRLRLGQLAGGWEDYESRSQTGRLPTRNLPGKPWRGQTFRGQRLLLLSEQGMGDAIWMARYLGRIKAMGGEVILEARKELVPLLASMHIADRIVLKGARLPRADWHAYICSLPGLFSSSMEQVSGEPYLAAPENAGGEAVAAIYAAKDCLRIGIVWSGSTTFALNNERWAPLAEFVLAFAQPGVRLFSLQKGSPAAELTNLPNAPVFDLSPMLHDFADTAAAVAALDLIIMTDSSVAHLAGALGRPVWLLLNFGAYWLWHEDRDDSPWYGSMRLFRAKAWNAWTGVFDLASAALTRLVAARGLGLIPSHDARPDPTPPDAVGPQRWIAAERTLVEMQRGLAAAVTNGI